MRIGIDKIGFFVPPYYLEMEDLAASRGVDPNKYRVGIGEDQMAVNPVSQDIITFAANAAAEILEVRDLEAIDLLVVGTESSLDESKASAVVLHRLLGIQPFARSFEIKEACYGATAGLLAARDYVAAHPDRKALVVASDIARYGLASGGEPTQGAGAVAILISANPRLLALGEDSVALTQDIYDFWRPTGNRFPMVDGKLSNETYIGAFAQVWAEYRKRTGREFAAFAALTFHLPYTKMGKKALLPLLAGSPEEARLLRQYEAATVYNRRVGNLYTGSLYLSLISLLEQSKELTAGDRVGLFSYGSGSVAEFFSGELVDGFEQQLAVSRHEKLLEARIRLTIPEYEQMFEQLAGQTDFRSDKVPYSLEKIEGGVRYYKKSLSA